MAIDKMVQRNYPRHPNLTALATPLIDEPAQSALAADKLKWLWDQCAEKYQPIAGREPNDTRKPTDMRPVLAGGANPLSLVEMNQATRIGDSGAALLAITRLGDTIAAGQSTKMLHPTGAVAKAKWIASTGFPFTGMLAPQLQGSEQTVLIRASDGRLLANGGFAPGLACKFLVNGHRSENLLVGVNPDGVVPVHQYFHHVLGNHLGKPSRTGPGQLIADLFSREVARLSEDGQGLLDPKFLPLMPIAAINADGSTVQTPHAPDVVWFVPNPVLAQLWLGEFGPGEDFRDLLALLEGNEMLFEVQLADPEEVAKHPQMDRQIFAKLVLETAFVVGQFGDERLCFRHPGR